MIVHVNGSSEQIELVRIWLCMYMRVRKCIASAWVSARFYVWVIIETKVVGNWIARVCSLLIAKTT